MGKIFTYTQITSSGYLESSDEWEDWGEDFEYEVDWADIRESEVNILFREYFSKIPGVEKPEHKMAIREALRKMIAICDLEEPLCEMFEDEIKEDFEEEAKDSLKY